MISVTAEQIRLFYQFGPIIFTIKSTLAKIKGFYFEAAAVSKRFLSNGSQMFPNILSVLDSFVLQLF